MSRLWVISMVGVVSHFARKAYQKCCTFVNGWKCWLLPVYHLKKNGSWLACTCTCCCSLAFSGRLTKSFLDFKSFFSSGWFWYEVGHVSFLIT